MARNPELAQRHITRPHRLLVRAGSRSRASPEWAWLRLQGYSGAIQDALQRSCPIQSGGGYMTAFGNPAALGLFPMPAIEEAGGLKARPVDAIKAARVHRDPVGLRARHIKRVHAAMRAERVLGHPGAERIDRQGILSPQQFEILRRGREVKDALLGADGAAALRQQSQVDPRPEAHPAAMTAAFNLL